MTLSFLRNHTLSEMKKLSQQLNDLIKAAYDERQRLIDVDSYDDVRNAELSQYSEPQQYYYFRFLIYGVSIVRRFRRGDNKPFYSIFCENWKPDRYVKGNPLPSYDFYSKTYGEYETLEEAIIVFKNFVIELFQKHLSFIYQDVLEIF